MNEIRYFGDELRVVDGADGHMPKIVGYAAVFNSKSSDLGGFREQIMPGAFGQALASGDDILALMYHDPKMILGRRSKGTLEIRQDDKGLYVEISPPNTSVGKDAVENVRRGDISGMSFRMNKVRDSWTKDSGDAIRTIHGIGLLREVTLTTIPSYGSTSVELRSADAAEATEYIKQKLAELNATPGRDALAKRLGY